MVAKRRPRFRYIVFSVFGEGKFSEAHVLDALDAALPDVSFRLIEFDGLSGIVRCFNTDKDAVIAAMNALVEIGQGKTTVRTVGTSGTIRRARSKYLR